MHDIGWAVDMLRKGYSVRRTGWNGKGMFIILVTGGEVTLREGTPYADALQEGRVVNINAHVDMFTAQGSMQPGWLCSQADLLATDWETA